MIIPILLCGGSGRRLWPLSHKSYSKQLAEILGEESLFQASARRFTGEGFGDPVVIIGEPFRFIVGEQLAELGVSPVAIVIESEGRNTAPAAAKLRALRDDPAARERKAEVAFRNVRENFSAEAVAQRYGARLREILEEL